MKQIAMVGLMALLVIGTSGCGGCGPVTAVEGGECEQQSDCADGLWCLGRVCRQVPVAHEARDGGYDAGMQDFDSDATHADAVGGDGGDDGGAKWPDDAGVDGGCVGGGTGWCEDGARCMADSGVCEWVGVIQVDPSTLDFGCVGPGSIAILSLSITNIGNGALSILDIRLENQDSSDAGFPIFSVESPRQPPFVLGTSESITLTVDYRQEDWIQDTNALVILSDDPTHSLVRVPIINGYKSAPDLAIVDRSTTPTTTLYPIEGSTPTFTYDLGEVSIGASKTATLTLLNLSCGAILALDDMTIESTGVNAIVVRLADVRDRSKDLETPVYLSIGEMVDLIAEYSPALPSDADETKVTFRTNDDDINNDGKAGDNALAIVFTGRAPADGGMDGGELDAGLDAGTDPDVDAGIPTCGPSPTGKGGDMCDVPAGPFWMGCNVAVDSECWEDENPYHAVSVPAFKIDKFEVTMGEYQACVADSVCTAANMTSECNYNVSEKESHPINCVDWAQAKAYCTWAGKRLPTGAEWEKAARGIDGRKYPWGNAVLDCARAVHSANRCSNSSTAPVGSKPTGASPNGVVDMIGNVWEWVEDDYHGTYTGAPSDGSAWVDTPRDAFRVVRGGSWGNKLTYNLRASTIYVYDSTAWNDYLGFRCGSSAP